MTDLTQFSTLIALWAVGFGLFAFMFQRLESRLEKRMDRLEDKFDGLGERIATQFGGVDAQIGSLRHDLAEEFRAQRAEVSAQVAAITNAIIASRG